MQLTQPPKTLAEPIVCAEFWRNRRGESVRIQLRQYEGQLLVDLRVHYTAADGTMRPTAKGLSIVLRKLPDLLTGVRKAAAKAHELGLLDEEAGDG
jgi:hypothetical protein